MAIHLDSSCGAFLIGMVVAATLHGVSCVQAFYYFTHQFDGWKTRLLVIGVVILDTVHQALITHTGVFSSTAAILGIIHIAIVVYTYTVTDWGDLAQLEVLIWSLVLEVVFTGATAFIVQSFLTMRIWRLSGRNIYVTGVSAIMVVGTLSTFILYVVKAYQLESLATIDTIKGESIAINVVGAVADLVIAITLCFLLNLSRTGYHKSDAVINKFMMFSVNTGLVTSLCAVASLISILASTETFIYVAFFFCIGRLYTNSLLATLNARKILQGGAEANKSYTMSVSLREIPNGPGEHQDISIKLDTSQEYLSRYDQKRHEASSAA